MNVAECVVASDLLPTPAYASLWESIIAPAGAKERLFNHAVLSLRLRARLPFSTTALHGLILLIGPPGTGKSTLALGVGQELTAVTDGNVRVVTINPHGLMSAEHGHSQQRVMELLAEHVPGLADDGIPTVVVLDEVESMAVARSAASLSANPADVHRATDAVLMAVDRNAHAHPHILVVATSNFVESLDTAFCSRADCVIDMPMPDRKAIHQILVHTLEGFAAAFPALGKLSASAQLGSVAEALVGADGRRVRKLVTEAMGRHRETALDPGCLTTRHLMEAAANFRLTFSGETTDAAA